MSEVKGKKRTSRGKTTTTKKSPPAKKSAAPTISDGDYKELKDMLVITYHEKLPTAPYIEKNPATSGNIHRGQLKLLLSEFDFLADFNGKAQIIIYVGAGPGFHLPAVFKYFPDFEYHLYDRTPFADTLKDRPNVLLFQQYFEQQNAEEYAKMVTDEKKKILFISDIRSTNHDDGKFEEAVSENMQMQADWVKTIKPIASMLKFRPPYHGDGFAYLGGEVRMQAFAPSRSAETRLISQAPYIDKKYNTKHYEEAMSYYNTETRRQVFEVNIHGRIEKVSHDYLLGLYIIEKMINKLKLIKADPIKIYYEIFRVLKYNRANIN